MPEPNADQTLTATRELMREARALIDGSGDVPRATRAGVLNLYESLCRSLEGIDGERVRTLLSRISEQVERLNDLARNVERIRQLRKSMGAS